MSAVLSRIAESASARHLLLIAAVSVGYESLFVEYWLNVVDEGLTLYAAMGVHHGGVLYDDVSFVFPPGHLLVAWISYALDPPGVVLSRILYAAFNVALCLALYPLAKRIMPPRYALFGVLLVAVASPLSHRAHLLFGFRYLVWSTLALLAFAERLRTGNPRWMLVAGLLIGVAVCFRLTPAFAAAVGIGLGVLAAGRDPRIWLRDGTWFAVGVIAVALPVVSGFAGSVGLETLWREIVVRPVVMTNLQSLPMPDLALPTSLDRDEIHDAFVGLLFRACAAIYAACMAGLFWLWLRAFRAGRRFDHPLLLAVVTWGAVYYLRSLGRSDEPHLSSAIPPFCVLLAFLVSQGVRALGHRTTERTRRAVAVSACTAMLAGWVFLPGADRALDPDYRGSTPFEPLDGRVFTRKDDWWREALTPKLRRIRERTQPGDRILDLTASPLFYVLVDRMGPGRHDIVMPGTFLNPQEEQSFVAQLSSAPPALAILRATPFDDMKSRSVARTAPRLMTFIGNHYSVVGNPEDFLIFERRPRRRFGSDPGTHPPVDGDDETGAPPPTTPAELDPDRPIDRMLATLARDLDANQVTDLLLRLDGLETRLGWVAGRGAFHQPPTTIAIGRELLTVAVEHTSSVVTLREALRLLVAHHQAHGMQSRIYTERSLTRPENRRWVEAQADILAGITLAQNQIFVNRPLSTLVQDAPGGVAFARKLGAAEGREPVDPDDRRRLRLLQVGRNVGVFYIKAWTCLTNLGEIRTRNIFDGTIRSMQEDLLRNPQLPHFDPKSCETEDVFDWTLRAAARELARDRVAVP